MIWQELVFLAGGFILAAALLPMVRFHPKPPRKSSGITFGVLLAYTVAFLSLEQYVSAAGVGLTALLWGILLAQALVGRYHDWSITLFLQWLWDAIWWNGDVPEDFLEEEVIFGPDYGLERAHFIASLHDEEKIPGLQVPNLVRWPLDRGDWKQSEWDLIPKEFRKGDGGFFTHDGYSQFAKNLLVRRKP